MKKILLVILAILLLTGCSESNNTNEVQEISTHNEISDSSENVKDIIEIENFLYQEVRELKQLENYIFHKSNEEAFMVIESDMVPHKIDFKGTEDEYYMVYVGEQYKDHKANWCWFYVSKNIDKILSYDIVEVEVSSLSEWRKTDIYSEKFEFLNRY